MFTAKYTQPSLVRKQQVGNSHNHYTVKDSTVTVSCSQRFRDYFFGLVAEDAQSTHNLRW